MRGSRGACGRPRGWDRATRPGGRPSGPWPSGVLKPHDAQVDPGLGRGDGPEAGLQRFEPTPLVLAKIQTCDSFLISIRASESAIGGTERHIEVVQSAVVKNEDTEQTLLGPAFSFWSRTRETQIPPILVRAVEEVSPRSPAMSPFQAARSASPRLRRQRHGEKIGGPPANGPMIILS